MALWDRPRAIGDAKRLSIETHASGESKDSSSSIPLIALSRKLGLGVAGSDQSSIITKKQPLAEFNQHQIGGGRDGEKDKE